MFGSKKKGNSDDSAPTKERGSVIGLFGSSNSTSSSSSSTTDDGSGISTPYNVKRTTHVTPDFNWEFAEPAEVFTVTSQIGKGYVSFF
jgi:hypothetical protein